MTISNTPGAWAKLRAYIYVFCVAAIPALMVAAGLGILPVDLVDYLIAVLIPASLVADTPHVVASLTGDQQKQQIERLAWLIATALFTRGFQKARQECQRVRQFWASDRTRSLREMGAIGVDLTPTRNPVSGRQSGGHKAGAGGHRKPASGGSDDDGEGGEPPANLPLIWTVHDLAATLKVSAKTLQNQPPHHLPPAIRIPGCKGPRYRLQDVLAWLDGFSAASRPPQPKQNIGRPRIASSAQIAAIRGKGV